MVMDIPMDIIFIEQLKLETIIGIHDWERENRQPIILDIEMACSTALAAKSDEITDCIDYFTVSQRMMELADSHEFKLVESFAEAASQIILNEFGADSVKITLHKPDAVSQASSVGVIIQRSRI
jgi:dihydroneopterin aldolase